MDKAPDAYRTISEVGEDLDLPQHVLRFWETRFAHIKPLKRGGGRRYYRPDDVELLKGIRHLLYKEGYTIKGVQRILKEQGVRAVMAFSRPADLVPEVSFEIEPPMPVGMPRAVAAPPAYAPPPPPVMSAPAMPVPVAISAAPLPIFDLPPIEMPPPAYGAAEVPAAEAFPKAFPESSPESSPESFTASLAEPAASLAEPAASLAEPAAALPTQVSMFRGGLLRAEPASLAAPVTPPALAPGAMLSTLPLVPAALPQPPAASVQAPAASTQAPAAPVQAPAAPVQPPAAPTAFVSSAYAVPPAAPAPGNARVLLQQAMDELSAARSSLDRLLSARLATGNLA